MGRPKSSFGFFHMLLQKTQNKLLGQPNRYQIPEPTGPTPHTPALFPGIFSSCPQSCLAKDSALPSVHLLHPGSYSIGLLTSTPTVSVHTSSSQELTLSNCGLYLSFLQFLQLCVCLPSQNLHSRGAVIDYTSVWLTDQASSAANCLLKSLSLTK